MEGKSIVKNIGKSAKKMRIPSEVVRGMNVYNALNILKFMNKGTAIHLYKALKSASANAANKGASLNDLYIKELRVDKGAIRVRKGHPKARGAGYFMMNRGVTNLIVVVSDEKVVKTVREEVKQEDSTTIVEKKSSVKKSVKKESAKVKSSSK